MPLAAPDLVVLNEIAPRTRSSAGLSKSRLTSVEGRSLPATSQDRAEVFDTTSGAASTAGMHARWSMSARPATQMQSEGDGWPRWRPLCAIRSSQSFGSHHARRRTTV